MNNKKQAIQIWSAFCEQLKNTGSEVLEQSFSDSELNQAEGLRYLTRLLRNGLEFKLEGRNPEFPQLFSYAHETVKMGADNPDIRYLNCHIDPQYDYLITGTRGTVNQLNISSHAGGYGDDHSLRLTGSLLSGDIEVNEDGSVEIILSVKRQSKNWLPLTKDSNMIIVRQIFLDRAQEQAAQLEIKPILKNNTQPHVLSFDEMEKSLDDVCGSIQGTAELFTGWAKTWLEHSNELPFADQQYCQALGGDPQIIYYHSHWHLDDNQALIIHLPNIPECKNWNLQINNVWMESLDYRFHRIHFNKHTAQKNSNGSVSLVLAHQNPQQKNWLHTTGHHDGTMSFRWVACENPVDPIIQCCAFDEIESCLKQLQSTEVKT